MDRLRRAWARCSWVDRAVVIALALLMIASVLVRPVWRALDPGLAIAVTLEEGRIDLIDPGRQKIYVVLDTLVDPWGRPFRVVCAGRMCGGPGPRDHGLLVDRFFSAGPDGVFQSQEYLPAGVPLSAPSSLELGGDDVIPRGWAFTNGHRMALFAPFVVLGLALSYLAARRLRPIPSATLDLGVSLLLGLPASFGLIGVGMVVSTIEPERALPWTNTSLVSTILGAVALMLLAVRRWHAPLEPAAARTVKTEAELEAELRALVE